LPVFIGVFRFFLFHNSFYPLLFFIEIFARRARNGEGLLREARALIFAFFSSPWISASSPQLLA